MEVDTEEHRLHASPCSFDDVIWCVQVGLDTLGRRISELSTPWRDSIAKMNELLTWKDPGVFMRPAFKHASNGLTAEQCFWDWDTKGVSLPEALEDPERLADLVQAKKNREFTIDEWMDTYWGAYEQNGKVYRKRDEYPIWPEEYMSHPGMDARLFKKLFGREPDQELVDVIQGRT
jgi:hypothetical protein